MTRTHGPGVAHASDCYGCKVSGLAFGFGSVGGVLQGAQGRNNFHGEHADGGTIRERRSHMIEEARSKGVQPVELTRREQENFASGNRI